MATCPAATGTPVDAKRCSITGAEHRCDDSTGFHVVHVCACGESSWYSSTSNLDILLGGASRTRSTDEAWEGAAL